MPVRERDLHVPKRDRTAFSALISYDADRLGVLLEALENLTPTRSVRNSVRQVADRARLPETEVHQILTVLVSLFTLMDDRAISREKLPDKVLTALEADSEIELPEAKKGPLRDFLSKVLNLAGTLGVTAKSWNIVRDSERMYCHSRILTDIRPVFVPETEKPGASIVIHNLKIAYHEGDDLREFFIALDGEDLYELRRVVDRAIRKEENLRQETAKTSLSLLEEGD